MDLMWSVSKKKKKESGFTLFLCTFKNVHNIIKVKKERERIKWSCHLLLRAKPGIGTHLKRWDHEFSLGYIKFEMSVRHLYDDTK